MVTSRPWTGFAISQRILLLFWSQMSDGFLITAHSWRYAHIHTGRKNQWVLLPERSRTRILDISKFWQSGEKSRAIFDPANYGLSLLPPHWRCEDVGGFVSQKIMSSLYFSIFHAELAWILTFHAISPKLAAHMQQSTLTEKTTRKMQTAIGLSPTNPTINVRQ